MSIEKQIEEALNKIDNGNDHEKANAFLRTELYRVEWIRHQQVIISQQAEEIERLKQELKSCSSALGYDDTRAVIENPFGE